MRDQLLTRHFLQRFLDNDLISPHADRRQILSVAGAALVSSGLFVTVLLSLKYLFEPFPSPGRTAVAAVHDHIFYVASSMSVMGLVAALTWDALALDARDTAILGPLPVPPARIVRAKAAALSLFGMGGAVALNAAPSVLHPLLMAGRLPIGPVGALTLILVHATVTIAAGAFAFSSVLGFHELLRAVLGNTVFGRISNAVQASLIVVFTTTLLVLPGLSTATTRTWGGAGTSPYGSPPAWFVGLFEGLAGGTIDRLPRGTLPERILERENRATALYRGQRDLFRRLGILAVEALAAVLLIAAAAYTWNTRRLPPSPAAGLAPFPRTARALSWVAQRVLVRCGASRAGFFFTVQCLWRSLPHRLSIVTALAIGLAASSASLGLGSMPIGLLSVQTLLVIAVLAGFRHAIRLPAALHASWIFHLAWSGDERRYLAGVKHAALAMLCVPVLLGLVPLHALLLGSQMALAHLVCGFLLALIVLEMLLFGFHEMPFTVAYAPSGNLKSIGPLGGLAVVFGTYGIASIERHALDSGRETAALLATMLVLFIGLRIFDGRHRRDRLNTLVFDAVPSSDVLRLDLGG